MLLIFEYLNFLSLVSQKSILLMAKLLYLLVEWRVLTPINFNVVISDQVLEFLFGLLELLIVVNLAGLSSLVLGDVGLLNLNESV